MIPPTGPIHVLHVDDEPDFAEVATAFIERESDRIQVTRAIDAEAGLDRLAEGEYDCVVSDFDMPGGDGIEFLQTVRERYPELPFILYTGKGSEEVAADAVSAGVTDYLQKASGSEQYTILANRIENAVAQYRAGREIQRTREYFGTLLEHSSDYLMVLDEAGEIDYVSPAVERMLGYAPSELEGSNAFDYVHPEDESLALEAFSRVLSESADQPSVEFRARHAEGSWRWIEVRGRDRLEDPVIGGVVLNARDVTEDYRRRQRREAQRETLVDLATDDAVAAGDFEDAVCRITATAAEVLDVDRVNVWLFEEGEARTTLSCVDHFDRASGEHASGMALDTADYPDYVAALDAHHAIDAADARADPRTAELTADYLEPHDIGALLGGTVRAEGVSVGAVCHEHLGGPREWTEDEVHFVSEVADIVGRTLRNRDRRRRERELLRTQRAIDEAPVGVVITDAGDGPDNPITYANQFFESLTGYEQAEVIGRDCRLLQGPDTDPEPVAALREAVEAAERESVVLRNYRADGSEFWNKVTVSPIHDEAGAVINYVGFQEDVTDRIERERALQRAQSRTEFALRARQAYVFEIDLGTGREERFGDWESLHGVAKAEVPTTEAFLERAVHPEDRERIEEMHASLEHEPGAIASVDYRTHPDSGEVRWLRARMKVQPGEEDGSLRAIGLTTDVTEHEREQRRVQALFENSVDPIAFSEFIDGEPIIREVNPAFEETFGCEAADALGRPIDELVVPEDASIEEEATDLNRRIEAGERVVTEVRRQAVDGMRDFLLQSTPLHPGESGQRTYAIYTDITDRKRFERALQRQNHRLEEFTAVVSHDLGNPLQVIEGRLELAREEADSEHLAVIADTVDRMNALIEDTLALARAGEAVGDTEPVQLAKLAESCWRSVPTEAAELVVEADGVVEADASRLRQLFENLLRNAVQHAGPTVRVEVGDLADGFYVEDDGPGIPAGERDAVLQPGHSTAEDGTGFGLNIVRDIAEAHGWEIEIADASGGGARFEVTGVQFPR